MIGISGYGNSPLTGYIYGGYAGVQSQGASSSGAAEDAGKAEVIKNPGESTRDRKSVV